VTTTIHKRQQWSSVIFWIGTLLNQLGDHDSWYQLCLKDDDHHFVKELGRSTESHMRDQWKGGTDPYPQSMKKKKKKKTWSWRDGWVDLLQKLKNQSKQQQRPWTQATGVNYNNNNTTTLDCSSLDLRSASMDSKGFLTKKIFEAAMLAMWRYGKRRKHAKQERTHARTQGVDGRPTDAEVRGRELQATRITIPTDGRDRGLVNFALEKTSGLVSSKFR